MNVPSWSSWRADNIDASLLISPTGSGLIDKGLGASGARRAARRPNFVTFNSRQVSREIYPYQHLGLATHRLLAAALNPVISNSPLLLTLLSPIFLYYH